MASKASKLGLGMVLGAVGGAVAGLFLAPKAGKELRKDAQKLYDQLSKDPEKAVKDIFGKVTDESMDLYNAAQKEVSAQLANLSENYKTLDAGKYKTVVKQAVDNVIEDKKLPEDQLKKLMDYLEKDVRKIASFNKALPAKAKKAVRKVVSATKPKKKAASKKV